MPDAFRFSGDLSDVSRNPEGISLQSDARSINVRAVAKGVFRVHVVADGDPQNAEPFSYAVENCPSIEGGELEALESKVRFGTAGWSVVVERSPLRIGFESPDGHSFAVDSFGPGFYGNRFHVWKRSNPKARFYGLGEKAYPLDRTGRHFTNWNTDAPGYSAEADPLYKTIPFFLCVEPREDGGSFAFGIFLDNSWQSHFDFGGQAIGHYSFGADGGPLVYYVIGGPTPAEVIRKYTALTGRTSLPPRWSLGYQQCRWSYYPDTEVRHLVEHFRVRHIPLDVLYLDIHYMHEYRIFTWDPHRFPDHRSLLADLRDLGVRTVIIVDPGVKTDADYRVAQEGLEGDHFVRYPDGSIYEGKVWPGNCYFPDFTRPATRDWFGSFCREALDDGVAGFWTDMNEPSNHAYRTLPDFIPHDMDGKGGLHLEAHNVYGMQMTRSVHDAAVAHRPDERPFVLTRAAFAGSQRYAAVWTGDNVSSWEHLDLALPMLLSLGISGVPFAGTDVAGFFGAPSAELFVRWMQVGAFSPLFRNHTIFGSPRQEPWSFGEVAEEAARSAIELRYRLLPYLYALFREHEESGLPPMRPLFLHYPDDEEVAAVDNQFLFGEHLLVAPALRLGAETRDVYLPAGKWFEFESATAYAGPRHVLVPAPLSSIPVFVRGGTCLPMGPILQHVDERVVTELELQIYPGTGETILYEDDGISRSYQNGAYRQHRFVMTEEGNEVVLRHEAEGGYESPLQSFRIRVYRPTDKATSTVSSDEKSGVDEQVVDATFAEIRIRIR